MSEGTGAPPATEIRITVRPPGGGTVATTAAVPAGSSHSSAVVPALHRICDALISDQIASTLGDGTDISCRPGCGACCRQLVPILESEAAYLAGIVAAMSAEGRQTVLTRRRQVLDVLESRGLLGVLRRFRGLNRSDRREVVVAYFRLGLACPFLEDESCSIYADRPLACREYLVTSPPEGCGGFGNVPVEKVPMPNSLLNRLLATNADGNGWAPLVLALERAPTQPQNGGRGVEVLAGMLGADLVQSEPSCAR